MKFGQLAVLFDELHEWDGKRAAAAQALSEKAPHRDPDMACTRSVLMRTMPIFEASNTAQHISNAVAAVHELPRDIIMNGYTSDISTRVRVVQLCCCFRRVLR